MSKERMISDLYFWMWRSADFEELFKENWRSIYDAFYDGRAELCPPHFVQMVYDWARENLPF